MPVFVLTSTFGGLLLVVAALAMAFNAAFAAAENMLVAHYTPFRWRSLAYGAKFVLALGIGGLTVTVSPGEPSRQPAASMCSTCCSPEPRSPPPSAQ